jgi:hypothetical protein
VMNLVLGVLEEVGAEVMARSFVRGMKGQWTDFARAASL